MDRAAPGALEGEVLDEKYRIEQQLGEGGMGAVYRASHLGTTRTVAVKVIRPRFSNDHEFVRGFSREAEAAGRLRHPNVVDVTDFGLARTSAGRVACLVMEYLDGCTLAEILAEEGRLPTDWVMDIPGQVCSAVDEAHRVGIIHRDLKPENIWLEPNRRGGYTVKVLDFGLAKLDVAPDRASGPSPDSRGMPTDAVTPLAAADSFLDTESPTIVRPNGGREREDDAEARPRPGEDVADHAPGHHGAAVRPARAGVGGVLRPVLHLQDGPGFSLTQFGFRFGASGRSALFQLLDVFVTPLTAIMTGLLYLKARQAGGESLADSVARLDALEVPRSRWQVRMRSASRIVAGGVFADSRPSGGSPRSGADRS